MWHSDAFVELCFMYTNTGLSHFTTLHIFAEITDKGFRLILQFNIYYSNVCLP